MVIITIKIEDISYPFVGQNNRTEWRDVTTPRAVANIRGRQRVVNRNSSTLVR